MTIDEAKEKGIELFVGEKGGHYYFNEQGKKTYCKEKRKYKRKYSIPRGAFARFTQANIIDQ